MGSMASGLERYFDSDAEREAYEAFLAEQERGVEGFKLAEPALVCRWRMADKHVPMLNRHIRALSQRTVNGEPLTRNMLSWVKQHVEWSLAEGDYRERDGVLMLVIDVNGNAAMTVGAYEPLADTSLAALADRASTARAEAAETDIAPELVGAVTGGRLLLGARPDEHVCGAATLVEQLAATRGIDVEQVLGADAGTEGVDAFLAAAGPDAAFFLVSDEHGVVPAHGGESPSAKDAATVEFLSAGIRKLFS